jgi:hypothetical protein
MKMQAPIVHLNGTSRAALLVQVAAAASALNAALTAISDAAPNARDYYPAGDDAFRTARKEHDSALDAVRSVLLRYEQLFETLDTEA